MRRADRLFQLVQLLRARRFVTGQVLADEVGVSLRTLYRDIRDLQDSGVPIRGEAGVGYHLERGYELPPLTFHGEEIEALVLGARMVEAYGDDELKQAARSAMTKVEAVLPPAMRRVLLETSLFAMGGRAPTENVGVVRRAVAEKRCLRFSHTRADGEGSERTVRPLGLYFWGRSWNLAAWCELRDDYRVFRPDRMAEVVVGEPFDAGSVSLEEFVAAVNGR